MDEKEVIKFIDSSNYRNVKNRRNKLKEMLVDYKGGKCEICGYDKCLGALDFHHLNPSEKDFTIGQYNKLSFNELKKEVDKCILVCANCHREIHYNEVVEKRKELEIKENEIFSEIIKNREKYGIKRIKDSYKYLINAGILEDIQNNCTREEIFAKYHINNRTFNKFLEENDIDYNKRKIVKNRPNKEELEKLLLTNSKSSIARIFGVTFNAVKKWCKKYDIE